MLNALGFTSRPPSTQQRKDRPLSSSVAEEKSFLLPCWYSILEAEVKGGFFSLTLSQIIALLAQWNEKLFKDPCHICRLAKLPADANLLMTPVPAQSKLQRGKGQQLRYTFR